VLAGRALKTLTGHVEGFVWWDFSSLAHASLSRQPLELFKVFFPTGSLSALLAD